jgi:flagellar M-ring protein FliF
MVSAQQAKAVRYLVASAVSGLATEDVIVIDSDGTLLGSMDETIPAIAGDDKAQVLRERVQRLLEARVGFGNSVVEVSVDTVTDSEEIRERSFNPEGRVAISTDTEERNNSSNDAGGGDVTVASNLPDENGAGSGDSASQNSETRERINYEVSETEREIIRAPGAIKRLTVAVLVNELVSIDENQNSVQEPRPKEELDALRELVSSAVGFDEERGDIITIKSMKLQSVSAAGTIGNDSFLSRINLDIMSALQMVILGIVSLILGLFVVRPLLSREVKTIAVDQQIEGATRELVGIENRDGEAEQAQKNGEGKLQAPQDGEILPDSLPSGNQVEDPVERLRSMIGSRQGETVEILRGWLEEKEEKA